MLDVIKKAVSKLFPELAGGLHLDRYARILGMSDAPAEGSSSERFRPRFAVDIQILTPELEPDPAYPTYTAVPLPVPMGAGQECGSFSAPEAGALCVVGFVYGRQDHPVIKQIYPLGGSVPQVSPGEILLQKDPAVFQRADKAGNWTRATDATITDDSLDREIKAVTSKTSLGSELKEVSEHSKTEVGSIWTVEAGTVATLVSGGRTDIGSLGTLNLTAGGNSTHSTAGMADETVGGDHSSKVKGNRIINIEGKRTETIGQGLDVDIKKDCMAKVGGESKEEVAKVKIIEAEAIILKAAGSFTLTGFNGEINLLTELGGALDAVHDALDVLSTHTHPNTGAITQGASVAGHANTLNGHTGNLKSVSG